LVKNSEATGFEKRRRAAARGPFLSFREDNPRHRHPRPLKTGQIQGGTGFALPVCVPLDVVLGRALACCAHPWASWRILPARGRLMLVAAYVSASYVTVLSLLLIA
jgi:hypothetical protein